MITIEGNSRRLASQVREYSMNSRRLPGNARAKFTLDDVERSINTQAYSAARRYAIALHEACSVDIDHRITLPHELERRLLLR